MMLRRMRGEERGRGNTVCFDDGVVASDLKVDYMSVSILRLLLLLLHNFLAARDVLLEVFSLEF
jgi:hypothetical protein